MSKNSIKLEPVTDASRIQAVSGLAQEIWQDYFVPIIGEQQVDYMLEAFQSHSAIAAQIDSGFEYYLLVLDERFEGYLGLVPDSRKRSIMISKIYIRNSSRGKGLGNFLLDFVKQECEKRGCKTVWLTVNRHNHAAIYWYKRKGFVVVDEVNKNIGSGFYMNDYIMELMVN